MRIYFMLIFLCAGVSYAFAQNRQVTGTVIDDLGDPLIGVSIVEKGTTNGTVSDIDGKYSLTVPGNATLAFSYMGYVSQELAVNNRALINITLSEDLQALEEVVVIGYGVQRKSDVTGAISKVEAGDIQNRSIVDANLALQGKTAGVQVLSASGAPGAQTDIRIRGISSNSGSSPLYIVDGMQVRSINFIDPNNIESMEVLKDAASAAIYGAQAGNGVVIITTKKGSGSTQGTITYDGQYVFNSLTRLPKVLNSRDYIDYMLEAGYTTQGIIDEYWDGKTDTNWSDVAFENGFSHRHNLSFSQASDQGTFFSSLSFTQQDGPIISNKDTYDRWTFLTNAERNIKPWLKVGVNFTYNRSQTKSVSSNTEGGSVLGSALLMDPLTPVYWQESDVPESYKPYAENGLLLSNGNGYHAQSQIYIGDNINPLTAVETSDSEGYNNGTMGTLFAEFKPIKGLVVTSRLSVQANNRMSKTYNAPYYANSIAGRANPELRRNANESFYYQWENFANYMRSFGSHDVTAMVGMSFAETHTEYLATGDTRLLSSDPLYRDFGWIHPDATRTLNGSYSDAAQLSYFGRLDYSYDRKYMLQFTLRSDAFDTSKLSDKSRWGYFPAISAGWTVSNEEFMENLDWVSSLKLRASWGKNGSIRALSGYQYSADMATSAGRQYDFTSDPSSYNYTTAYYPNKLSNPNLKWETSVQLNIGLDARFLNNRLNFTFDWYEKKTDGLLVSATPPLFTGYSSMYVNGGDIKNSGFEFELGWNDNIGDFRYGVKANLATLNNKVTYLDPSITRINGAGFFLTNDYTVMEEGYPIWYMRGYDLEGIDPTTGDPIFRDMNDDGIINAEDKTKIGSGLADFTYGITLTGSYKNFDFVVSGSGSQGNDMYMCLYRPDRINGNRLQEFFDNRWTMSNTNASAPRAGANDFDKYIQSSGMIFDGSYFKISQIQLGYTVPRNITSKLKINNLRAYVSLDDWFLFASYPGFDPSVSVNNRSASGEVTGSGVGMDKGSYPTYKKTTIGINITF
ncbi:TonB-dependent receptor [Parabacteroides sp. OttesenSCG-928-G07]|nr:TonB-dependent receptor [Parabacteroides sp. OttesenSCG-928-G07]